MLKKIILYTLLVLLLSSCTFVNYRIDNKKFSAKGQNERIKFIVIHYTATTDEVGIRALTGESVSSHYLITTKSDEPTYNLVPDEKRAWHAGISEFNRHTNLNDTSIGIEISNKGIVDYDKTKEEFGFFIPQDRYIEYSEGQIKKLVNLLQKLILTYNIKPTNILGHSDIAPTRKIDPGAKFPWERLYREYGIGAWYDEKDKIFYMNEELYRVTPIEVIKEEFRRYGYKINTSEEWDEESKRVVYSFQAHFNQDDVTGEMDLETYAILKALNKKYRK
jgi:N-acetylmuramoyl-L-alanine amidase